MILLSGTTLSVPMTSLWNINNKDKVHDADNNTVARCARDGGASRHWRSSPKGLPGRVLWFVPLCWSLFQLWYASPLPFIFDFGVLNDTQARSIHLTFAVFLAFTAYPAMKGSPRDRIPLTDWLLALAGSFSAAYIYLFTPSSQDAQAHPLSLM